MPHFAKPFFVAARGIWRVQVAGKQFNLGPDRDAAFREYHRLMAAPPAPPGGDGEAATVAGVADAFLGWCHAQRSERTYAGHKYHLERFVKTLPSPAEFPALGLKPGHVEAWLAAHPAWGPTYRRNAVASVKQAFAWAAAEGLVPSSPVARLKRPQPARRDMTLTPDGFGKLLAAAIDSRHRDLLVLLWETGMRPQEARAVEARHYDPARARLAFPPEEAKGKRRWRVVLLTDAAAGIVGRLAAERPAGPLLRNARGEPWTAFAVANLFRRLGKRAGVSGSSYQARHNFATRLIKAGASVATVAGLMGHADPTMTLRVYQHVADDEAHLRAALTRGSGA